jgi:hypothetical protein
VSVAQSTANANVAFTESSLNWDHSNGVAGSGSLLVCFVGAADTSNGSLRAKTATFSSETTQNMTLAHEVTGNGPSFPSLHIFTLPEPSFSGIPLTTGTIQVNFDQPASNINALSVCFTGVNTTAQGFAPGSFIDRIDHNLTVTGTISGTLSTAVLGDLLVDCVVANAGSPDTHSVGKGQTLDGKVNLNSAASSAMSISHKLAVNLGDLGMTRSDITALNTVTSTAFIIYMN